MLNYHFISVSFKVSDMALALAIIFKLLFFTFDNFSRNIIPHSLVFVGRIKIEN